MLKALDADCRAHLEDFMNRLTALCCTLMTLAACGLDVAEVGEDTAAEGAQLLCPAGEPDCGLPTTGTCPVAVAPPTTSKSYSCDLTLLDSYGRPVAGQQVVLTSSWCSTTGTVEQSNLSGYTGATGRALVTGAMLTGNRLNCHVVTTNGVTTAAVRAQNAAFPSGTTVQVDARKRPSPTATRSVTGLVAGAGQLDLYQSGAYDKVVVIPEYFDVSENDPAKRRDAAAFWKQLEPLMLQLNTGGWDVWLFQPRSTGDNLHEQSAELAQAIQVAARGYGGAPSCGAGNVVVFGINTGGVVARLATARWEADPSWRSSLGLQAALPVSVLATGDSPHFGMHFNVDLQKSMASEMSDAELHTQTNLDSCAAAQLIRKQYLKQPGTTSSANRDRFFASGAAVVTYSQGQQVTCAAGPALATLNSARGVPGWPSTPRRIGFSNGTASDVNHCYGAPNDQNAAGDDLCKYISDFGGNTYNPRPGDSFVKVVIGWAPDRYWNATADDLVPGSRSPLFFDGYQGNWSWGPFGGSIYFRQRFSPTMIPSRSADGTEGPTGARPSPFNDFSYNFFNGSADQAYLLNYAMVLRIMNEQTTCPVLPVVTGLPSTVGP